MRNSDLGKYLLQARRADPLGQLQDEYAIVWHVLETHVEDEACEHE